MKIIYIFPRGILHRQKRRYGPAPAKTPVGTVPVIMPVRAGARVHTSTIAGTAGIILLSLLIIIRAKNMKSYNGGKSGSGTYQQIINHIPPHNIYVAPFAGHDGIFRKIRRAAISVLNDIDPKIIETWKRYKIPNCDIYTDFMQGTLFEKPIRPVVILRNNDYQYIINKFAENTDAFIYCDPPYPMATRKSQARLYAFEWETETDHAIFLRLVKGCKCNVMVSSYPNDQYNEALQGWHKHEYYSTIRGGKDRRALEVIYMNYPAPVILHDFQFLGSNYRERENIKEKVKRHIARMDRLPPNERTALLSAFIQLYKSTCETLIKL